ncbi:hypothetical protein [Microbulbifer sp. 2205BS26-8]|uniref:hypothetical protein n=1 Tax=Microbulbifer sp. 2205BS26-8 TaxID=3064386 RepID=UPI00273D0066|nr:hypothetical protein [Microbulbifer sp. 2205BS26-8]MDP5209186.1 hypothetical protein [Microbulbifer sp. 2205BS26-8]
MVLCSFRVGLHNTLPKTFGLLLLSACCLCSADDLFIPDSHQALNIQSESVFFSDSAFAMDNTALFQAADYLRNNTMSGVQRRLNYQWLQMHTNPNEFRPTTGGKVLSKILKMGWETYKQRNKRTVQNSLLRYTTHQGKIGSVIDYNIRLSNDKFHFSFEYEF